MFYSTKVSYDTYDYVKEKAGTYEETSNELITLDIEFTPDNSLSIFNSEQRKLSDSERLVNTTNIVRMQLMILKALHDKKTSNNIKLKLNEDRIFSTQEDKSCKLLNLLKGVLDKETFTIGHNVYRSAIVSYFELNKAISS
jgi:hypothetical protein